MIRRFRALALKADRFRNGFCATTIAGARGEAQLEMKEGPSGSAIRSLIPSDRERLHHKLPYSPSIPFYIVRLRTYNWPINSMILASLQEPIAGSKRQ
jgi:hypothetical protein